MAFRIATIVGARPQFIKAAPVSKALRARGIVEVLIHTGQHYDVNMSDTFFDEMKIPTPDLNLRIGSGTHGQQTGQMLIAIESALMEHKPDMVLVYGDTNSTIAGALAAIKLHIDVSHVEAGLRSFNRLMPEEHNRVLTDHCSTYLFCPTQTAVRQLATEGITNGVYWVGDTMYDAVVQFSGAARERSTILAQHGLMPKTYFLATIHRPYNTDDPDALRAILHALARINEPVIFPVHPRTRKKIAELGGSWAQNITMIEPVGYLDMLTLQENAKRILTDSGGVQKESFFMGVPCITLRMETEWVETIEAGWNILVGADTERIVDAALYWKPPSSLPPAIFGDGNASERIADVLLNAFGQ